MQKSYLAFMFFPPMTAICAAFIGRGQISKGHHHYGCWKVAATSHSRCNAVQKATLTEETVWKLRFVMKNLLTVNGRRSDAMFVLDCQFLEDENYEPPQGSVHQLAPTMQTSEKSDESAKGALRISSGRWKLSEDPNERKDGLWIWGLFKEPLYPFLLLTLDTEEVKLPGECGDSIAPMRLFAQIGHARNDAEGVVLKPSTVNVREMVTVKADPFGGATVDLYDDVAVGQIRMEPHVTNLG